MRWAIPPVTSQVNVKSTSASTQNIRANITGPDRQKPKNQKAHWPLQDLGRSIRRDSEVQEIQTASRIPASFNAFSFQHCQKPGSSNLAPV